MRVIELGDAVLLTQQNVINPEMDSFLTSSPVQSGWSSAIDKQEDVKKMHVQIGNHVRYG